jgi:hypothetical protein
MSKTSNNLSIIPDMSSQWIGKQLKMSGDLNLATALEPIIKWRLFPVGSSNHLNKS